MVPGAGLEPTRPCGREILSLLCKPFHHPGTGQIVIIGLIFLGSSLANIRNGSVGPRTPMRPFDIGGPMSHLAQKTERYLARAPFGARHLFAGSQMTHFTTRANVA